MHRWLFTAKPLPEPMLTYWYQLYPSEQISTRCESKHHSFYSSKCFWKCCLQHVCHFCSNPNISNDIQDTSPLPIDGALAWQKATPTELPHTNRVSEAPSKPATGHPLYQEWIFQWSQSRWHCYYELKWHRWCLKYLMCYSGLVVRILKAIIANFSLTTFSEVASC